MLALTGSVGVCEAQDVIVKKDGSTILSKVLEVNTTDIKYKKNSNLNGPTYTINKEEIQAINYEGGDIDKFEEEKTQITNKDISRPKSENDEHEDSLININYIDRENHKEFTYIDKVKNEDAKYHYRVLNIHKKSKVRSKDGYIWYWLSTIGPTSTGKFSTKMHLYFENESDRIIYIDLANCLLKHGLTSESFFVNSSTEVTKGKNGGAGVNIGAVAGALGIGGTIGQIANGVIVGGGRSSSTTVTTYNDRIIAVAPHSKYDFPDIQFEGISGKNTPSSIGPVKIGEMKSFEEPLSFYTSPWNVIVSYSFDQNFEEMKQFNMGLFIAKAVGLPSVGTVVSLNSLEDRLDKYFTYSVISSGDYSFNIKPKYYVCRVSTKK